MSKGIINRCLRERQRGSGRMEREGTRGSSRGVCYYITDFFFLGQPAAAVLGARHEDHSFGEKWGEPFSDFLNGDWDLRGGVTGFPSFFLLLHLLSHSHTHAANSHDRKARGHARTHTRTHTRTDTHTHAHTHTLSLSHTHTQQQTSTTQRHTNWTRRSSTRGIIRTRKGSGRARSRKRKTMGRARQGRGGDVVCVCQGI